MIKEFSFQKASLITFSRTNEQNRSFREASAFLKLREARMSLPSQFARAKLHNLVVAKPVSLFVHGKSIADKLSSQFSNFLSFDLFT